MFGYGTLTSEWDKDYKLVPRSRLSSQYKKRVSCWMLWRSDVSQRVSTLHRMTTAVLRKIHALRWCLMCVRCGDTCTCGFRVVHVTRYRHTGAQTALDICKKRVWSTCERSCMELGLWSVRVSCTWRGMVIPDGNWTRRGWHHQDLRIFL